MPTLPGSSFPWIYINSRGYYNYKFLMSWGTISIVCIDWDHLLVWEPFIHSSSTLPFLNPFTQSSIHHSLIPLSIYTFIHSLIYPPTHWIICPLSHPPSDPIYPSSHHLITHSFIQLCTHPYIHLLTFINPSKYHYHPSAYQCIYPPTHPPIHSLTSLSIHS